MTLSRAITRSETHIISIYCTYLYVITKAPPIFLAYLLFAILTFSAVLSMKATIKLTNLSGQQLLERSIDNTQSIENVDLSSLKKGVYFINITSDSKSSMIKVIKR